MLLERAGVGSEQTKSASIPEDLDEDCLVDYALWTAMLAVALLSQEN